MNYNFYADKIDKIAVIDFIFNETDLQIYDLGSPYGQEICKYKSTTEITEKFDLTNGDKFGITFNLWTPRHKGKILFRKIDLDPKRCNGHTFRYSTDGWGLIQLYFGGIQNNGLNQSHIGHFNEKGALKWEKTNSFNGRIDQWDWTEIQKTSRNLKNRIHNQMSIRKIYSLGVLPGADKIEKQGFKLM